MPETWLTPEQLGQQLKRSLRTLRKMRRAGGDSTPPFSQRGTLVLYAQSDVDAWLRAAVRISTSETDAQAQERMERENAPC